MLYTILPPGNTTEYYIHKRGRSQVQKLGKYNNQHKQQYKGGGLGCAPPP
jgi:hypothetical protein